MKFIRVKFKKLETNRMLFVSLKLDQNVTRKVRYFHFDNSFPLLQEKSENCNYFYGIKFISYHISIINRYCQHSTILIYRISNSNF